MQTLIFKCYSFVYGLDPPKFNEPPSRVASGTEGEHVSIPLSAEGNPQSITYTWTKDGGPISNNERIIADGPILNITKLTRKDDGIYTCEAVNSQGSDMINITVAVECKLINFN